MGERVSLNRIIEAARRMGEERGGEMEGRLQVDNIIYYIARASTEETREALETLAKRLGIEREIREE